MAAPPVSTAHRTLGRRRIVVVGGGVSGIAAVVQLKRRFGDAYAITLIERSSSLGGTWLDNHYPGAECDVPSHFYSYSFAPNPAWSQYYSPASEIKAYLQRVAADNGVMPHCAFNTEFVGATWDGVAQQWIIRTRRVGEPGAKAAASGGGTVGAGAGAHVAPAPGVAGPIETSTAHFIILSSAALNRPAVPDFPGLATFAGTIMHTARWRDEWKPDNRDVVVIGAWLCMHAAVGAGLCDRATGLGA